MDYVNRKRVSPRFKPRVVLHGGAGNIHRDKLSPEKYNAYRRSLISIVSATRDYMEAPEAPLSNEKTQHQKGDKPTALSIATYAVTLLEDDGLFNSGHGAVFTRDGINELEASVMVSRGHSKRGIGVTGLRHIRNPIELAQKILEHGDDDLAAHSAPLAGEGGLDIPSAQGHTLLHGPAAEQLAENYGLKMVDASYFFTKQRWEEHMRALERERTGKGLGTWAAEEYLPQGTCGAVAMDETGTICVATSTGGMTNKLTGRIGDTPVPGAGFWAEQWEEAGDPTRSGLLDWLRSTIEAPGPSVTLSGYIESLLPSCISKIVPQPALPTQQWLLNRGLRTTRAMAGSGTGNGDSFMRCNALRTMAAMARWKPETSREAVRHIAGPGGELQQSAGERWGKTGEGEGGIIGIECSVVRDSNGRVIDKRSEIVMDYNCGGMFRAWIDEDGKAVMSIWSNTGPDKL